MSQDSRKDRRLRSKKAITTKSTRLEVRMSPEDRHTLQSLAERHGLTVSAYVTRQLLEIPTENDSYLTTRHRPSPKKAELYQAVTRSNLLLAQIRDHLADADGDLSRPLLRAVLTGMIAIEDKLHEVLVGDH